MTKISLLICLLCAFVLQSCDFHDFGNKDHRIKLPEPMAESWGTAHETDRGNDGYDNLNLLSKNTQLHPICGIAVDSDSNSSLVMTDDGRQLSVSEFVLPPVHGFSTPAMLNYKYRHFVDREPEDIVGLNIDNLKTEWGDNIFFAPLLDSEGNAVADRYVYTYPHIMLLTDGRYLNGVRVEADSRGVITGVSALRGVQRNLFGSMPFYEKVLAANLMERVVAGPWVDKMSEVPSRGVFVSLIYPLVVFFLIIIVLTGIACAIFIPVDRYFPSVRRYVAWLLGIIIVVIEYYCLISLLDFYSAGWWFTVYFLLALSATPIVVMLAAARHYCPECKGHDWMEDTRIIKVEYPEPKFKQEWTAFGPRVTLEDSSLVKITKLNRSRCKGCGHVEESESTNEEYRKRTICPVCFKETLQGEFTNEKVTGGRIEADYREWCDSPGCGYASCTHVSGKCMSEPVPQSRPARRRSNNSPEEAKPAPCRHCVYVTGEGLGSGEWICNSMVGKPVCHYIWGDEWRKCSLYSS